MRIDILTLFPEMFTDYLQASIMLRAQQMKRLTVNVHNIRDHATGKHRITDEPPYGGGGGMVLKPEPIFIAIETLLSQQGKGQDDSLTSMASDSPPIILLTPQGRPFDQEVARQLVGNDWLLLICGRYEGVDERVRQNLVTDEISIGDYVLTGGELAAMVVVDAVTRLIPGVLGAEDAAERDSHSGGLLEGPHYTRPEVFRNWAVPKVLLSGHATQIASWRRRQALRRTWLRRPEMLLTADLSEEDKYFLAELAEQTSD